MMPRKESTMTIQEAMDMCDALKPNQYALSDKVRWLSQLDGTIYNEIITTHEGYQNVNFAGYNSTTPLTTALLAAEPYSELYGKYLAAQVDFHNAEFARYNNSVVMFNAAYQAFADYYNRAHKPLYGNAIHMQPAQ